MRGLDGKRAVVTGGGGGIGSAICRRFAEEGVTVAIFDIAEDAAQKTAESCGEVGPAGVPYVVDITDSAAVTAAVRDFEQTCGPIDILVNNAGWDAAAPFVDTDPAHWERVIAINFMGPLNLHMAIVPGMRERGQGRIVNISSDAARVDPPTRPCIRPARAPSCRSRRRLPGNSRHAGFRSTWCAPAPPTRRSSPTLPMGSKAARSSVRPWSGRSRSVD